MKKFIVMHCEEIINMNLIGVYNTLGDAQLAMRNTFYEYLEYEGISQDELSELTDDYIIVEDRYIRSYCNDDCFECWEIFEIEC